jgi:hypothetical protein
MTRSHDHLFSAAIQDAEKGYLLLCCLWLDPLGYRITQGPKLPS